MPISILNIVILLLIFFIKRFLTLGEKNDIYTFIYENPKKHKQDNLPERFFNATA